MKINQLKFGIYLSYASIFITNITNLVLTPFIIRNVGQSEYGLYMLIGAFIGYLAVLDFGFGNATVRFVSKYRAEGKEEEQENFLSLTFILYFFISIIVLIVGTTLYFNLENIFNNSLTAQEVSIAKVMFIILMINLVFTLPMKSFTAIINGYEKFTYPKLLSIGKTLLRVLSIVILLSLGYNVIAIVVIDTILNFLFLLVSMAYVFIVLKVKIKFHGFDKSLFKELFNYSSLIFISVIVDQLYWRIGHLVLGIVAGTNEVALFAIGMTFGQYFITFSTAMSGLFLPKVTKMVVNKATGEELTDLLIKTGRLQFFVLGLALGGFLIFGRSFIYLWVGEDFLISWKIALLIMLPLFIVLTQTVGITILQAKNMHGFRALMYLCIAIVNLLVSIFLAKKFGAIGAAAGTVLSLIFGNIIGMNIYYFKKVKLNIPRFFGEVFGRLLLSFLLVNGVCTVFLLVDISTWSMLVILCLIYTGMYILVMWFLGLNNYEKSLFKNEFAKVRRLI